MATADFFQINGIVKNYNQSSRDAQTNRISLSIIELQYMDIFSQKFKHISQLNQLIKLAGENRNELSSADNASFVFKLNYLQASIAIYEFLLNADALRKNLWEIYRNMNSLKEVEYEESNYFKHWPEIEFKMDGIKHILKTIHEDRYRESPISIGNIEMEMRKISKLYTMTSERFVLQWLIKHTQSTIQELIGEYNLDGYDHHEGEVELF